MGVCMRHWLKFLVFTIIVSLSGTFVLANTLTASISGESSVEAGGEITLTFSFEVDEDISQMKATLDFDSDMLEVVGIPTALNGLDVLVSENFEITVNAPSGVSGAVSFMQMTFRAKEAFKMGTSSLVSLSGVSGILLDSQQSVSGSGSSRQITAVPLKSDNNFLADLYTNAGDIGFDRNTFEYSLIVENEVSRIRIVAKAEDISAQVKEIGRAHV